MRLFPISLILCVFLSSFTLVHGMPGYWATSVDKDNPNYINLYLKPNSTKSQKGFAELCDYNQNNTCEDVADLAPIFTKKKGAELTQAIYYYAYPPHTKSGKQLTVIVHYDYYNSYKDWAEKYHFINNETTLFMEYKWTTDKFYFQKNQTSFTTSFSNTFLETMQINVQQTYKLVFANLAIAFCVFFGSLAPRCFVAALFIAAICQDLFSRSYLSDKIKEYLPIFIILLINLKPNPRKRLIALIIVFAFWEIDYQWNRNNQASHLLALSLLLTIIMAGISYQNTKEMKHQFTIISTAHIGVCATLYLYNVQYSRSLPSWFGLVFALRHIVSLISVAFQVMITKEYVEPDIVPEAKTTEDPTLLSADQAAAVNNDALTNNLL